MSETDHPRPLPDPPRSSAAPPVTASVQPAEVFAGLADRPVAEHVAVFETEHERLRRDLSTIDQL